MPVDPLTVSVVIPTYGRGAVLLQTLKALLNLPVPAGELIAVDQTPAHPAEVADELSRMAERGAFRWIRLEQPSIPRAMNTGLREARGDVVLFLDDDIVPCSELVAAHAARHGGDTAAVCGQVLQPGEVPEPLPAEYRRRPGLRADLDFPFKSSSPAELMNVMAGNLSVRRDAALAAGGFDERFVGAAYRFETEFARRLCAAGGRIVYEPAASIRHLRIPSGGTREQGDHLRHPSYRHAVGDYYFALRHGRGADRLCYMARRLVQETVNRFYARHPWLLPRKLCAELRGLGLAMRYRRETEREEGGAV